MDRSAFDEYVGKRYRPELEWYDRRAVQNERRYKHLQWGLIVLSSLTPVLVAAGPEMHGGKVLALCASVLVAVLSTALKTFKFEESWLNYRASCELLRREIYVYQAGVEEYKLADDKESLFIQRIERILSNERISWLTSLKAKSDTRSEQEAHK